MGASIFEDPDFFERVVLGVSGSSRTPGASRAEQDNLSEIEPTEQLAWQAEQELKQIQSRLEHQRLTRHASQICAELRRRRDSLERRREVWERRDAELEVRERTARLWVDERVAELLQEEQRLVAWQAELQSRAAALAAWELQLENQSLRHAAQANDREQQQELQARTLNQHSRQLAQREANLAAGRPTQAVAFSSNAVSVSPSELSQQSRELAETAALLHTRPTKIATEDSSLDSSSVIRQEVDERVEQLIRWECELSKLFAAEDQEPVSKCNDERAESLWSRTASDSASVASELAAWNQTLVGELQNDAVRGDERQFTEKLPESPADWAKHAQDRVLHLDQLLQKWETLVLAALEDRVVTQEVHRHLCESCDSQTLAQLETSLHERLRPMIESALELVDQQRTELTHWLAARADHLRHWMAEHEAQWLARERRWRQLKQRWLGIDSNQSPLTGPHTARTSIRSGEHQTLSGSEANRSEHGSVGHRRAS